MEECTGFQALYGSTMTISFCKLLKILRLRQKQELAFLPLTQDKNPRIYITHKLLELIFVQLIYFLILIFYLLLFLQLTFYNHSDTEKGYGWKLT